jgi:uncharacterized RDD family membrane protein YckC
VVEDGTEGSPFPKCSLVLRLLARALDVAVAFGLYVVAARAGAVVAFLYLLLADGMFGGQSVGKRLAGVKVISLPHRTAARYRESVLRNAPLGLVVLLGMMPDEPGAGAGSGPSAGTIAFCAGAVLIGAIEGFKVLRHPLGIRLGDLWAETQVVDGKDVAADRLVEGTAAGGRTAPDRVTMEGSRCASR